MVGKIERYLHEVKERDGVIFFGLIDPFNGVEKSLEIAKAFYEANADVILLGGSLGIDEELINRVAKNIKEEIDLPVILFPGNINGITRYADALYFMSLLNSSNTYWITGAQALAAPLLMKLGIEAIPTSLLIIEPGEAVGWVGEARPIPLHKPEIAAAYALAGKYLGQRITILERGSGAPGPAPAEMFAMIKKVVGPDHLVISAGSCKTLEHMRQAILAGADGIHVASLVEKAENPFEEAKKIVGYVKEVGKEKIKT